VMFVEELVKEFPAFMEHRSSSPCSEVPAIWPYLLSVESTASRLWTLAPID
jgi:hypothetical protein